MTKITMYWLVCLILALGGISCKVNNPVDIVPTITPTQISITTIPTNSNLTSLIGKILKSPDMEGQQVEIIGYFRGWDLLDEAGSPPPATRSDWVIADNSGAIYVTGLVPDNLDPSSPQQVNQIVRLTAVIRVKGEQVYLEGKSVELFRGNQ